MKYTKPDLSKLSKNWNRSFLLVLFWILGIVLSFCIFSLQQALFSSLMRSVLSDTVSIVGLFTTVLVPFSATAFAVLYSKPYILYALCFIKSTLYSLSVLTLYSLYGGAGWLVQLILLFAENATLVMLWFLWSNNFACKRTYAVKSLAICASVCTCLWILDYRLISQFAVSVFSR